MEPTIFNLNGIRGFYKIWAVDPTTGKKKLLRDKPNMLLNQGADLLAQVLAGKPHTNISHMYIGYKTSDSSVFDKPTIDRVYSVPFSAYGTAGDYEAFGYLRLPLAFSPSFIATDGYESNIAMFTTSLTVDAAAGGGDTFHPTPTTGATSQIFEVALVAATDPTSANEDVIFARSNFEPLVYNSNFNLTTTWGVQFIA